MDSFEHLLCHITMAPYIVKAMALIGVKRRGGSNMFRHQIATMGILIDYKIVDPILLKASVIHDLFEDAEGLPGVTKDEITSIDSDGPAVYDLVLELTRRRLGWIAGRGATEAYYFANAQNLASIDLHAKLGFVELTRDFHVPGATFAGGVGILFRVQLKPE